MNAVLSWALPLNLFGILWKLRQKFTRARQSEGQQPASATIRTFGRYETYGLCRAAGSVNNWSIEEHDSVIRDIEVEVPGYAHSCRVLWAMFDDTSDVGRVIPGRLENIIKGRLGDVGLFVHGNGLMDKLPIVHLGGQFVQLSSLELEDGVEPIVDPRAMSQALFGKIFPHTHCAIGLSYPIAYRGSISAAKAVTKSIFLPLVLHA